MHWPAIVVFDGLVRGVGVGSSPSRVQRGAAAGRPHADLRSIDDLVAANRILAMESVLDGMGHVSVRHPRPGLTAFCSRARWRRSS